MNSTIEFADLENPISEQKSQKMVLLVDHVLSYPEMLQVAKSIRPIRRVGEKSECHHRIPRPRKPSSGRSFRSPKGPGYGVLELCLATTTTTDKKSKVFRF